MNKTVLLLLAGSVALLTESCSFFTDFSDARKELEENAAKPIPVNNAVQNQNQKTDVIEEEFADLEDETEPAQAIAGLIPATNPEVRVRSIARGRQDPFSIVNLTPRIEIEQEEVEEVNRSTENRSSQNSTPRAEPSQPSQGIDSQNESKSVDPPEPEFEPTLAQNVIISGLYKANDRVKLIVQAPEESTSRYVEVGQYLSNGQVLVKDIDWNHFPTPVVTLEQSGIEVSKEVGETPGDSNDTDISSLPSENSQDKPWLANISLN
ncbi:hypothetical protein [Pleurocapsa sp. PCC 7319]|uniref:hypothetical protein n=1 Tax=Pleurocapsa sp. PCC 7319 TaxID=118161 RepID=UPI00034D7E81|nr:hypothetical protein [Pleurocapsa sp. PCC 7319]